MFKKLFGGKDDEFGFVTQTPTKDSCPYCGYKFEKIPTREKKCPDCRNYIFVRFGKLYTEEEKNIKDWLENYTMQQLDVTREMFNRTRQELSQELGFAASVNDTLWRILNRIVAEDKSYTNKKMAYQAMESILKSEGKNTDDVVEQTRKMEFMEGKIANEATAKAFREKLLEIKNLSEDSGIEMLAKIQTINDSYVCDECKKLHHKTYTLDNALETMPIPHSCKNAECRCWYTFEFPDND